MRGQARHVRRQGTHLGLSAMRSTFLIKDESDIHFSYRVKKDVMAGYKLPLM